MWRRPQRLGEAMRYVVLFVIMSSASFAEEATVTLTKDDLGVIVDSVRQHAFAEAADARAKAALDKVNAAFAPKAPTIQPSPTPTK